MKKRVLTILMCVLTVSTLCIIFSSCGEKTCMEGGTAHQWGDWETTAATCAKSGSKIKECELCGEIQENESYAERNPATGIHNYNSENVCYICGTSKYDCDNGKHNYGTWTVVNATCIDDAKRVRTCSICGTEEEDETYVGASATGEHNYVDYVCTMCGRVDSNKPNCQQGGNVHSWTYSTTVADCTHAGSRTMTCPLCGTKQIDSDYAKENPALGHTWGSETMSLMQIERTCTVCGQKQTRALKNIALTADIVCDGAGWGTGKATIADGSWTDGGFAFMSNGYFEFTFSSAVSVDQIAVACSSGSFKIEIMTTTSGGEYITFASGAGAGLSEEAAQIFDVAEILGEDDTMILAVKVSQETESYGGIWWGEVAIGKINESAQWKNAN